MSAYLCILNIHIHTLILLCSIFLTVIEEHFFQTMNEILASQNLVVTIHKALTGFYFLGCIILRIRSTSRLKDWAAL